MVCLPRCVEWEWPGRSEAGENEQWGLFISRWRDKRFSSQDGDVFCGRGSEASVPAVRRFERPTVDWIGIQHRGSSTADRATTAGVDAGCHTNYRWVIVREVCWEWDCICVVGHGFSCVLEFIQHQYCDNRLVRSWFCRVVMLVMGSSSRFKSDLIGDCHIYAVIPFHPL